jgi:hypothetical protein
MENWSAKYLIYTEALLNIGEIKVNECIYRIISISGISFFGQIESNPNFRILEVIFEKKETDTIEDAYIKGLDYLDEFIDRFFFISFSSAFPTQCISVSKECVDLNEVFEIFYIHYYRDRVLNNIDVDKINFLLDEKQKRYLRLLRSGLLDDDYEKKLLNLFTVLEQIAFEESKETIKNTCLKCDHIHDTGRKQTNNQIKQFLTKFGFTKKDIEKIIGYRGKIAHGGGTRDQTYYLDINKYAIQLEAPVYNLVIERIKEANIQNDCKPHIHGYPFVKTTFKYIEKEKLEYGSTYSSTQLSFSTINTERKSGRSGVGFELDENNRPKSPQPFALPRLNL